MPGEVPGEGLLERLALGGEPAPCQRCERLRVGVPAYQCGHHLPSGDPEDVAGHHTEFDLGVLQQLLHPLLLRGPDPHQIDPVAGQIPHPANLRRGHKTRADHLPFGDLAQPHRVQLVRLGPPGQVLDVAGVDQPDLQPLGLQQIEHRIPVTEVASITTRSTPRDRK